MEAAFSAAARPLASLPTESSQWEIADDLLVGISDGNFDIEVAMEIVDTYVPEVRDQLLIRMIVKLVTCGNTNTAQKLATKIQNPQHQARVAHYFDQVLSSHDVAPAKPVQPTSKDLLGRVSRVTSDVFDSGSERQARLAATHSGLHDLRGGLVKYPEIKLTSAQISPQAPQAPKEDDNFAAEVKYHLADNSFELAALSAGKVKLPLLKQSLLKEVLTACIAKNKIDLAITIADASKDDAIQTFAMDSIANAFS